MASAFDCVNFASDARLEQFVAKPLRLRDWHDIIVGPVNQQKRRRGRAHRVNRRELGEPAIGSSSNKVPFTASRTPSGINGDVRASIARSLGV
jgi:hypothetical protein